MLFFRCLLVLLSPRRSEVEIKTKLMCIITPYNGLIIVYKLSTFSAIINFSDKITLIILAMRSKNVFFARI